MSVWMLTGDKGATAKEIGVSCGLVTPAQTNNDDPTMRIIDSDAERAAHATRTYEFKETYEEPTDLFEEIKRINKDSANFK